MANWRDFKTQIHLRRNLQIRARVISSIRSFFREEGFLEVETPLLVPSVIPESYLEMFTTDLLDRRRKKRHMYLTASPEATLKKLIVAHVGNVFEITRSFRNGETDSLTHSPEFTLLEWYRVHANYQESMIDCQNLLLHIMKNLHAYDSRQFSDSLSIAYQDNIISLEPPWIQVSVSEALEKYSGILIDDITDKDASILENIFSLPKITEVAGKKGYRIEKERTWEDIFHQIFLNEVEPQLSNLPKPVILYDYPAPMAALAKLSHRDRRIAERFELYISGLELADCYTELQDAKEQEKRFIEELKKIKNLGKTPVKTDGDFLDALNDGLPPCSGVALGVDRLIMLFTNSASISDIHISY